MLFFWCCSSFVGHVDDEACVVGDGGVVLVVSGEHVLDACSSVDVRVFYPDGCLYGFRTELS